MKPVNAKITKPLPIGARLIVADNSGAKIVEIIGVKKGGGQVKGRLASAGVGDIIIVAVKKGRPEFKKKRLPMVIIRQKKEFRRPDGTRVKFEDNACVMMKDLKHGEPQGSVVKGAMAKEAAKRFPKVGKIARIVL
ncbi:MAG: 50S ribosomal protein L14 [Nanoarchaeota archaeon]|nr:50S ribosomal protein L14 [Nanoarchaeota archaeon]